MDNDINGNTVQLSVKFKLGDEIDQRNELSPYGDPETTVRLDDDTVIPPLNQSASSLSIPTPPPGSSIITANDFNERKERAKVQNDESSLSQANIGNQSTTAVGLGDAGDESDDNRPGVAKQLSSVLKTSKFAKRYSRVMGDTVIDAVREMYDNLLIVAISSVLGFAYWANLCQQLGTCAPNFQYNIALGVVSLLVVAAFLTVYYFAKERIPEKGLLYLSLFLTVWWFIGLFISTFAIPLSNGTGYFAAWCAFAFSCKLLHGEMAQFRSLISSVREMASDQQEETLILVASIVVLIAACFECGSVTCDGFEIFAIVLGFVSTVICILLIKRRHELETVNVKRLSVFLGFLWTGGLAVVTIGGPFIAAGNGLYGAWVAFLGSYFLAHTTQDRKFDVDTTF